MTETVLHFHSSVGMILKHAKTPHTFSHILTMPGHPTVHHLAGHPQPITHSQAILPTDGDEHINHTKMNASYFARGSGLGPGGEHSPTGENPPGMPSKLTKADPHGL